MCGIAITWNLDKSFVEKMCAHQSSRGPDFVGIKQDDKIVAGHTRLSIIDKYDRSNQPLYNEGLLTYNGEIYSYPSVDGKTFESDTLYLNYLLWKHKDTEKLLNSLNGMWSFAYCDDDMILLARDRFGIKPLYFYKGENFFAAASTPAAVALTKSNWNVSQKGVQEYLSLGATMLHSMFEGIEAVPPGHYAVFNCKDQSFHVKRWYYPKFIENAYETIEAKVSQAIERVKLTCDEPQIILLSGGVDSSLVASHYQGQKAIHLSSPEQEYAQKVADKFRIQLNNVHPSNYNAEECLTDYITKSGDPTMAGIIPYITCSEIKKLGFRVAITANGADELFFGYDRMKNSFDDQQANICRIFDFTKQIMSEISHILPSFDKPKEYNIPQMQELYTYLMFDLNKTLDFASMCHSVEVRVPYLDHELVEAALSISMDKHIGKYGNKTILKKMLVDLGFDWDFIHRPKIGFSLHYEPNDLQSIKKQAMNWYNSTDYPKLDQNATGRQQSYHEMTVLGLHLFDKIWGI